MRTPSQVSVIVILAVLLVTPDGRAQPGGPPDEGGDPPWVTRKRENLDRMGGLAPEILAEQSLAEIAVPAVDSVIKRAQAEARKAAAKLLDPDFHQGRVIRVPDEHPTVQAGIDAAESGDSVLVRPGTYYELLVMKDGVRLVSDSAEDGDELVAREGALLRLPRRTYRTILDGSRSEPSHHGMVDFTPGIGHHTVIDGFTFQNLPAQNHHVPGHAHGLNVRGASPVIMNCLIQNNGSTGIGNHVVYRDQSSPMAERDFRFANIAHHASPVIYNNIIRGSLGLGIGCNHFSTPHILGNEVYDNDDSELGDDPSPGIGGKHGSAATVIGNIVHDNPGGGILTRVGARQGAHPIDRSPRPAIMHNLVMDNGELRPAISTDGAGDREHPVRLVANHVLRSGSVGIGVRGGSWAIVQDNMVVGSKAPGIAVNGATALELIRNQVLKTGGPGFTFTDQAVVRKMEANAAADTTGPRFMVQDATFGAK